LVLERLEVLGSSGMEPKNSREIAHFPAFLRVRSQPEYMHFGKRQPVVGGLANADICLPLHSESGSLLMPRRCGEAEIRNYYEILYGTWGAQHWWPAETRFEVIVGAYLTQNTSWTNVERALKNLREARVLTVKGIRETKLSRLERLIRPSGYFRQKAKRLKNFVAFLDSQYAGSLDKLFAQPTEKLREQLLALNGVGPETADSILLYAGDHLVFVVDAYTRRILERHDILPAKTDYEEIRELFQRSLAPVAEHQRGNPVAVLESGIRGAAHHPSAVSTAKRTALVQVYNEMHGLIVGVGKNHCGKSQPKCEECPLQPFLPRAK
jgi:endonuclease III related protein